MKLIFKLIKFIIFLVAISPFILLAFMYKGYEVPKEDFVVEEQLSFTDIAAQKLDLFLASDTSESFEMTLTTNEANVALKELYASGNTNFLSTDESIPYKDRYYAMKLADFGGFKGANMIFSDQGLTILAGAEVGFANIYYKTVVEIGLDLDIEQVDGPNDKKITEIKLSIKKVNLGNVPVFGVYDGVNWLVQQILGKSINDLIQETVSGIGRFDLDSKSISITTDDLRSYLNKDSENKMLSTLLVMVDELDLIDSTFTDSQGGVKFELGKLRTSDNGYQLTDRLTSEQDVQTMFKGQLSSLLLSSLSNNEFLTFNMHEVSFNQLIDYYVGDKMNISEEINLGDHVYEVKTEPLFARFVGTESHFKVILSLNKKDETNTFRTSFTLKTTPSISENGNDLIFTINGVIVGDDNEVSQETIMSILALIGDNEIIQGNQIVLSGFLTEIKSSGVNVKNARIDGQYIKFDLEPTGTNAQVLQDLQGAIGNAIEGLTDPAYQGVLDAYETFKADPTSTDSTEVLNALNALSPTQQQALFNSLVGSLSNVENLENLLP